MYNRSLVAHLTLHLRMLQVTSHTALSWLISIASRTYQTTDSPDTSEGSKAASRAACEALHASLRSERAIAELLTQENLLALSKAHQLEQLCCRESASDGGCASLRSGHWPMLYSVCGDAVVL